jgi:DNA-directed RNA polymerase specialized sigma24 family protein
MPLRNHGVSLFVAFAEGEPPDSADVDACLTGLARVVHARYPGLAGSDVHEIASDAITALFEAARGGREIQEPAAWMMTVARRGAYDAWKALQRTVPSEDPLGAAPLPQEAEDGILQLIDALADRQLVKRAIRAALAADDRTVIRVIVAWLDLYETTGQVPSVRTVEARTGVPHSTVAKALTRFAKYLGRAAES